MTPLPFAETIEPVCEAVKTLFDGFEVAMSETEAVALHGFNPPPPKDDTAELPGIWALTGPATDDETSGGANFERETRDYVIEVPVMAVGEGTPNEREPRCRPVLQAVKTELRRHPKLGGLDFIDGGIRVVGDTGITKLSIYTESDYIGFQVRIRVKVIVRRTYAANE